MHVVVNGVRLFFSCSMAALAWITRSISLRSPGWPTSPS